MAEHGKQLYEKGLACEKAGDTLGAFEAFRRSAKANPRIAAPYVGLSRLLMQNHQRAQAIVCLDRAVTCESNNPALHILLGQALVQDGQLDRAHSSFLRALSLKPDAIDASIGIGGILEDKGDRPQAAATYAELLQRVPGEPQALSGLLAVAEGDELDQTLFSAQKIISSSTRPECALIAYSLGKALSRRGDAEAAFSAWERANTIRRNVAGAFDRERFDARILRLQEIFTADFFAARKHWGEDSSEPVFIVGLPRSGTTLTEQILASHPGVFGAGELDLLTDMATGTPDLLGRPVPAWPDTAPELQEWHINTIAGEHLNRLRALAPMKGLRIVDKQPLNFWHLGLVALIFPNAAVVHCTRDIRDNGLSIFAENFTAEQRWATDLSDIVYYWRGYLRLMAHWKAVSGLRILDVSYEETINNLEVQARQLTQHLGLPWDSSVLDFHESDRAVQTPSRWQVRKPLYSSSVGRWEKFGNRLQPLQQAFIGQQSPQSGLSRTGTTQ